MKGHKFWPPLLGLEERPEGHHEEVQPGDHLGGPLPLWQPAAGPPLPRGHQQHSQPGRGAQHLHHRGEERGGGEHEEPGGPAGQVAAHRGRLPRALRALHQGSSEFQIPAVWIKILYIEFGSRSWDPWVMLSTLKNVKNSFRGNFYFENFFFP